MTKKGIDKTNPKKETVEYKSLNPLIFLVSKNIDCLTSAVSDPKHATASNIVNKLKAQLNSRRPFAPKFSAMNF